MRNSEDGEHQYRTETLADVSSPEKTNRDISQLS